MVFRLFLIGFLLHLGIFASEATDNCHFSRLNDTPSKPVPSTRNFADSRYGKLATRFGLEFVRRVRAVENKYGDIDRILGVGGMGIVVEISSPSGKRVIKIAADSIEREVSVLRDLEATFPQFHAFPRVLNVDLKNQAYEMTGLYVSGKEKNGYAPVSLQDVFSNEIAMSPRDKKVLKGKIIKAVATIHETGYVHRDLSPNNVLFHVSETGELEVFVTDFGLAARIDDLSPPVGGTPGFASPNQRSNRMAQVKDDTFALDKIFQLIDALPNN